MITVLCLNPCMDKTATIETFAFGGMNRILESQILPMGKGVNVAMNLRRLGLESCCVGLAGQENAQAILRRLEAEHVEARFQLIPGAVRTNIKLLEKSSQIITEINEPGPLAPPEAQAALEEILLEKARASTWVVLTGSLPKGYTPEIYGHLIRQIRRKAPQCQIALDAEGPAFALGVQEGPDLVKPNHYELELFAGHPCKTLDQLRQGAQALQASGVKRAAISMGGDGALMIEQDKAWFAPALPVKVYTTVGAGDALLSGLLGSLAQGKDTPEAFRFGVAMAAATVAHTAPPPIARAQAEALLPQVALELLA